LCEKHRVDTVWNLDVAKFMFLLGLETTERLVILIFWEPKLPTIRSILITIRCVLLLSHTCPTLLQTSVGQFFDSELTAHQMSDWVYMNISNRGQNLKDLSLAPTWKSGAPITTQYGGPWQWN
jgi:hypothetical protein